MEAAPVSIRRARPLLGTFVESHITVNWKNEVHLAA
jgi:hypothetical protein